MAPRGKSQGPSGVKLTIANDMKKMVESGDNLTKARGVIFDTAYLDAYRCKVGSKAKSDTYSPYGLPLIEIMKTDEGRKVIDTAMQAVVSIARDLNWKSASQHQRDLAAAAGQLMDLLGFPLEPEIKALANEHAANFQSGDSPSSSSCVSELTCQRHCPLILQALDDGCRYLYLIEVPNCPVFKLGTLKAEYSRGRKTVQDRFINRTPPALPRCCDVKWDPNTLVLKHLVKTALEPIDPDVVIHERLRAAAKEENLLNCGQTEFHDRALFTKCKRLMDEAALKDALDSVDVEAVKVPHQNYD